MARRTAGERYQIGELAARGGVTPDTLRYYERLGLLPEAPRTVGGFRLYSEAALERLRFIKQAQTLGLTLHEVGDLVRYQEQGGIKRCRQVRDLLRAKLEELQQKLAELEAFKQTLSGLLGDCARAGGDGSGVPPRRSGMSGH
jgi:DNA-binding transcriptional MerR regulator